MGVFVEVLVEASRSLSESLSSDAPRLDSSRPETSPSTIPIAGSAVLQLHAQDGPLPSIGRRELTWDVGGYIEAPDMQPLAEVQLVSR